MKTLAGARGWGRWGLALLLCVSTVGLTACEDGDGLDVALTPSADWSPAEFLFSRLAVGNRAEREVVLTNLGEGELLIARLEGRFNVPLDYSLFYYTRPINGEGAGNQLVAIDRGQVVLNQVIRVAPQHALVWVMEYEPSNDAGAEGSITFETNDVDDQSITIPVRGDDGGAEINVSPTTIDFGRVGAGDVQMRTVTITNIGSAALMIDNLVPNGSPDFSVQVNGTDISQDLGPLADPDGDGNPGLESGTSFEATIIYAPEVDGPDSGEIRVESSDPNRPTVTVSLTANGASPCIQVNPETLEFAAALQGRTTNRPVQIQSCGGQPLEVNAIYMSDDSSPVYAVSDDTRATPFELPAREQDREPPSENAVVAFTPEDTAAYGGKLIIESNDPLRPLIEVPVTGRGTLNDCPVAAVAEDDFHVLPLDIIELDGSLSTDADGPNGRPVRYNWVVTSRPDGSTAEPVESFRNPADPANTGVADDASTPNALFFVDLAGVYTIELTVVDNLDLVAPSETCQQPAAVITVEAQPDEDIHVQMVWNTPGDADQTDGDGSDVDLHFRHPLGNEWVGALDCYYANSNPDWGPQGPAGDPSLDIDDVNGAGPENINLDEPEDTQALGGQYRVGIDYYRADNFATGRSWGPSEVTVRIFLGGVQAGEWVRVMQDTHHFWTVGSIIWSANERRVQEINRYYQQVP